MADTLSIGIIGCGNISQTYLSLGPKFRGLDLRACADINMEAAEQRASEYGVRAETVDGLLAADDIDIIVNLTIPAAHFEISKRILEAGKHVYSEKPFVLSLAEGQELATLAKEKGLRIGSAPDTFLGGSHQLCRSLIDDGAIGKVSSGTCHVMSRGMEHWHPNPDFFFKDGGGPILDLGPYYITNLVQLLGPVKSVAAMTSIPSPERVITSQPRNGETITVETETTIHALLSFESGATITFGASWDVKDHSHNHMELYGETGTLYGPDPNFFGGEVRVVDSEGTSKNMTASDHPFAVPNQNHGNMGDLANYRAAGLSDMALSILEGREHRCNQDLALHVADIMFSILQSGRERRFIDLETTCQRPAALGAKEAQSLLQSHPVESA
ncbi:Gfo/Idh/MocA family oxidoreductase [Rhodobacteraceae bacterium RKSG542]|uniref:Gfo/Idh/MocA family protein n=1 Tax=Pseudovibrio flavus TaxID=2529854 RepID=UPI0012BCEB7C|nr:Gfo/Idh/MocA family oxidoreductase [Pseudovibrio flavus]MTI18042.1 Gfo/Idh/MocA family oxidoreductase [Pseudovibrio flavus]